MTGPDPAVGAVRLAVRRGLTDAGPAPVLVACSGGADSLALLAATVFERRRDARPVIGVTVDHGLQEDSTGHAERVVVQMAALGATETMTIRVRVDAPGLGPEAAAREARYAALSEAAQRSGAATVLLGHTLDDQAETVLLGLTRGSGGRSIAGMRSGFSEDDVLFLRPLLGVTRAQTEAACAAEGIEFWRDPHNEDDRYTRSRLRRRVLPVLEEELGPGVASALARTAGLLQADLAALDDIALLTLDAVRTADGGLDCTTLEVHYPAVFTRVLRRAAVEAGSPPSELFEVHVGALVDLMHGMPRTGHGPSPSGGGAVIQLPGHVTASLEDWVMRFRPTVAR